MRREFKEELYKLMQKDSSIWVITADLGYKMLDEIREEFPERFINAGASEQAACGIAVGLAMMGKKPIFYSITPFLLYRCLETIRNYIDHEKIPVILCGGGRGDDYAHDGFSHYAGDDYLFMRNFLNIHSHWPSTNEAMKVILKWALENKAPYYINLIR